MTHNELQDLLPLYVLGGLEPEAAAEVERHLAETCDACSAEVRAWQEVLGLIPFGLTQTGPSPAVKERLMARVRRDAKVVPLTPRRRSVWLSVPLAIAAAVLLVIGWGRYQTALRLAAEQEARVHTVQTLLAQARATLADREQKLQQLQARFEQQRVSVAASAREVEQLRDALARQKSVIEVLSAPGLQVGKLGWAKRGVDSQGHVLWNEAKKTWLFYSFGMPDPPPEKEYQVWFMTEEEGPVSAGLFRPDQAGTGLVVAKSVPPRFGKVTAAAVTLEPAGGLPKPSGEMYLRGAF